MAIVMTRAISFRPPYSSSLTNSKGVPDIYSIPSPHKEQEGSGNRGICEDRMSVPRHILHV